MKNTVANKLPDLPYFTGTEKYHAHQAIPKASPTLILTDGAKYVSEKAGASWLMDKVSLNASRWLAKGNGFATVKVAVEDMEDIGGVEIGMGVLTVTDGNYGQVANSRPFETDFPAPGISFFLAWTYVGENQVPLLMLQSEY